MKYIKEYNEYVDPFDEEDWDEVDPDGSFLTWLKIKYLDESKWKDIKEINCNKEGLTDLIGIDKLINLRELYCQNNQLNELDTSKNIKLIRLYCYNNHLTELDVSKNIKLSYLICEGNQLTELDVSKNIKLTTLHCGYNNHLTELDIRILI